MNWLDVVLVVVAAIAAVGGFRLGFVTRAVSWVGLAAGLAAGLWLIPRVLRSIRSGATQDQLFLAAATLLVVAAMLGQAVGLLAGSRLSHVVRSRLGRRIDQVGGATAGVFGVVTLVWLLGPAMAAVPGSTARVARRSEVLHQVDRLLPGAPDATRTLRRMVGDRTPEVFGVMTRTPDVGPVPGETGLSSATISRVEASTVKVVGQACAVIQEGSGFVVAPDTVVTNAHVVAGEHATRVETTDGRRLVATVEAFDPDRDVAVLHVEHLGLATLPRRATSVGDRGAVIGYPGGGVLKLSPFRVSELVTAVGTDIYDRAPTRRAVAILASDLAPGDSGAPLVDPSGSVVGLAFAISPDRPGVAYALQLSEVQAVVAKTTGAVVGTGRCVS